MKFVLQTVGFGFLFAAFTFTLGWGIYLVKEMDECKEGALSILCFLLAGCALFVMLKMFL